MISSVNDFVGYLNMVQLSDSKFEQSQVCFDIGLSVFGTSIDSNRVFYLYQYEECVVNAFRNEIKSPELLFWRDISMPSIGRFCVIEFDIRWIWLANGHWNLKRSTCEWQFYDILFWFIRCQMWTETYQKHQRYSNCECAPSSAIDCTCRRFERFDWDPSYFFFRFVMRYLWCFHLRIITSAAIFYAFWQRFAFKCIKYFDNFVVGFRIWSIPFHLCRLWPGIGAVKTICSFWINLAFFTFHLCNYII